MERNPGWTLRRLRRHEKTLGRPLWRMIGLGRGLRTDQAHAFADNRRARLRRSWMLRAILERIKSKEDRRRWRRAQRLFR